MTKLGQVHFALIFLSVCSNHCVGLFRKISTGWLWPFLQNWLILATVRYREGEII